MKKRNLFVGAAIGALHLVALTFVVGGCETESVTQTDIQVRPAYTELSKGQSVALTASGWSAYRWSVTGGGTANAYGYLSAGVGQTVLYTAISTNVEQLVTAAADATVATTTTTGTNSTTTTSTPYSGTARIRQR